MALLTLDRERLTRYLYRSHRIGARADSLAGNVLREAQTRGKEKIKDEGKVRAFKKAS
jgi:hypothetical protein